MDDEEFDDEEFVVIPMMLAGWDLVIVVVVLALMFGGSKIAGLGKSAGTAIREFKEETKTISAEQHAQTAAQQAPATPQTSADQQT